VLMCGHSCINSKLMFLQVRGHIAQVSVSGSLHNDSTFKPSIAHRY
jgi:hypothetical protein